MLPAAAIIPTDASWWSFCSKDRSEKDFLLNASVFGFDLLQQGSVLVSVFPQR